MRWCPIKQEYVDEILTCEQCIHWIDLLTGSKCDYRDEEETEYA